MTATDTRCINCQRRGTRCVGQEFPDDLSAPMVDRLEIGHRMGKVEDLLGQVLQKVSLEKGAENIQPPPPFPPNGQIPVEVSIQEKGCRKNLGLQCTLEENRRCESPPG